MKKIIVITGQTATGKTKLAINFAKKLNGEVINCDSRQIYKHLNIVTGKDINIFKKEGIKIYLYNIIDPKEYFSSYDYAVVARKTIYEIIQKKKTPIVVGGTYLYLKHLLYGFETENIRPNWALRKSFEQKKVHELQEILKKHSIQSFNRLNPSDRNNPRRLIRKIEVVLEKVGEWRETGMFRAKVRDANKFNIELIGLKFKNKERLKEAIQKRVEERVKQGAFEETKKLVKMDYAKNDPGLNAIGYRQIIDYLEERISKQQAIEEWIKKEVQYAKRQYTFMKKDPNIRWTNVD